MFITFDMLFLGSPLRDHCSLVGVHAFSSASAGMYPHVGYPASSVVSLPDSFPSAAVSPEVILVLVSLFLLGSPLQGFWPLEGIRVYTRLPPAYSSSSLDFLLFLFVSFVIHIGSSSAFVPAEVVLRSYNWLEVACRSRVLDPWSVFALLVGSAGVIPLCGIPRSN